MPWSSLLYKIYYLIRNIDFEKKKLSRNLARKNFKSFLGVFLFCILTKKKKSSSYAQEKVSHLLFLFKYTHKKSVSRVFFVAIVLCNLFCFFFVTW